VNPLFGAYLTIFLGANGNQFILPSSAEVGVICEWVVPEPSTWVILALGIAGLFCIRRKPPRCKAG
jgi:hypothetical protein